MSTDTPDSRIDDSLDGVDGEVAIRPGRYAWNGYLDIGSDGHVYADGGPDTVTFVLDDDAETNGTIEGALENVVLEGVNSESKAGYDLHPGAYVDGFIWPGGGQQDEDRAFYTPDGGDERIVLRNSAWAWFVSDGAYCDKPPMTVENCASVNNNISGIRVGHRDGTPDDATSYVRNCLIAATDDILNDSINSSNARGISVRHPGHIVIEGCYFLYRDVDGAGPLINLDDDAVGATVEIRDCVFYNDSGSHIVRDKSDGGIDVTVENCYVAGDGNREIEPDYDGSGLVEVDSVAIPTPAEVTGHESANYIDGPDYAAYPWSGDTTVPDDGGDDGTTEPEPDEPSTPTVEFEVVAAQDGPLNYTFTVDGTDDVGKITTSETVSSGDNDDVTANDDGTYTVSGFTGGTGYGDAYELDETVTFLDWSVDDPDYDYTLYVDGMVVWPDELVSDDSDDGDDGTDEPDAPDDGDDTDDGTDEPDTPDDGDDTDDTDMSDLKIRLTNVENAVQDLEDELDDLDGYYSDVVADLAADLDTLEGHLSAVEAAVEDAFDDVTVEVTLTTPDDIFGADDGTTDSDGDGN